MLGTPVPSQDSSCKLNCLLKGKSIIFLVTVGHDGVVSKLKKNIKEEWELGTLKDVDPQVLELWKVSTTDESQWLTNTPTGQQHSRYAFHCWPQSWEPWQCRTVDMEVHLGILARSTSHHAPPCDYEDPCYWWVRVNIHGCVLLIIFAPKPVTFADFCFRHSQSCHGFCTTSHPPPSLLIVHVFHCVSVLLSVCLVFWFCLFPHVLVSSLFLCHPPFPFSQLSPWIIIVLHLLHPPCSHSMEMHTSWTSRRHFWSSQACQSCGKCTINYSKTRDLWDSLAETIWKDLWWSSRTGSRHSICSSSLWRLWTLPGHHGQLSQCSWAGWYWWCEVQTEVDELASKMNDYIGMKMTRGKQLYPASITFSQHAVTSRFLHFLQLPSVLWLCEKWWS